MHCIIWPATNAIKSELQPFSCAYCYKSICWINCWEYCCLFDEYDLIVLSLPPMSTSWASCAFPNNFQLLKISAEHYCRLKCQLSMPLYYNVHALFVLCRRPVKPTWLDCLKTPICVQSMQNVSPSCQRTFNWPVVFAANVLRSRNCWPEPRSYVGR